MDILQLARQEFSSGLGRMCSIGPRAGGKWSCNCYCHGSVRRIASIGGLYRVGGGDGRMDINMILRPYRPDAMVNPDAGSVLD